jgi:hypothetical protein
MPAPVRDLPFACRDSILSVLLRQGKEQVRICVRQLTDAARNPEQVRPRGYDFSAVFAQDEFLFNSIFIPVLLDLCQIILSGVPDPFLCRAISNALAAVNAPVLIMYLAAHLFYPVIDLGAGVRGADLDARSAQNAFFRVEFDLASETRSRR